MITLEYLDIISFCFIWWIGKMSMYSLAITIQMPLNVVTVTTIHFTTSIFCITCKKIKVMSDLISIQQISI